MPLSFQDADTFTWAVEKIAVIGPGIVGMPMAAMLAAARIVEGTDRPARVVVGRSPQWASTRVQSR